MPTNQEHRSQPSSSVMANGRVGVRSAPRAARAMAPERAGTERASHGGVSLAWSHTNSEGPHRGTSLLGRTRRRVGGLGSMPSPSDGSQPAGQKEKPHAVKRDWAAHPQGKTKPRSEEKDTRLTGKA